VSVVEDMISRKWIDTIVSPEETSTQIQVLFTNALELEGLLEAVEARLDGPIDITVDDDERPILLAVSDNGAQMTSGSTREFMALCAIAQHFGQPGTPSDQAWIETLFGHIKGEFPHLDKISDAAVLRRARDRPRALQRGASPCRHRLRHPERRTRRARQRDPRRAQTRTGRGPRTQNRVSSPAT
jgi:transposase InsO family protein